MRDRSENALRVIGFPRTAPIAPLNAVDAPEVVRAFAVRIREPRIRSLGAPRRIGVGIPDFGAERTELRGAVGPMNEA